MTTADVPPRTLPATDDNLILAAASVGTNVRLRGVTKRFSGRRVLDGLDLDIRPGEFVSLLGPSGCGKTTALRIIAGLEAADAGSVEFGGRDVSPVPTHRRDIGMVFQSYSLFPHLDALHNTAFGLRRRGVRSAEALARAADALDLVGLEGLGDRYAGQLSGGQQQRVALARALVTEPRVLLLDEPLSALDAKVRVQLRDEIRRIQLRLGITTVFVTHDQEEALAVSDRVAVMAEGRIEQFDTPEELYRRPATPGVAAFVGVSSPVPGIVTEGTTAWVWGIALPLLQPVGNGPAVVFVRPENVRLGENGVRGVVQESVFVGSHRRTLVRTDDGTLVQVQHASSERLAFGEEVRLDIVPEPVVARSDDSD